MKAIAKRISLIITVILILSLSAFAVPQLINYQGALSDYSGPVNGDVSITFTIYNAPAGGDVLWSETQTVTVTDGVFNVLLGSQNSTIANAFDGNERYLSVKVDTDPEMTPRQQLASVPFALRCAEVACTPGDFEYCYSGLSNTINIGECRVGTRTCGPDGTFEACVGEVPPAAELCDTLDNDCDPVTPDGSEEPTYGNLCDGADTDLCNEGTIDCLAGVLACSEALENDLDLCNGDTNDDCNAATQDGSDEPTLGNPCDGADSDLCFEGNVYCSGVGGLACSDSTDDTLDLCNGNTNDDCNAGTADGSDEAWLDTPCDGPDADLCEEGIYVCSAGAQTCNDSTGDTVEICGDSIDNDCDGVVDQGCCMDCHNQAQGTGNYRRQIVGVGGDFESISHHVTDGTSTEIVSAADCEICHDQGNHQFNTEPQVVLKDPDVGSSVTYTYDGTGASIEAFCLNCHDANSSQAFGTQPFTDGRTPTDITTDWAASSHNSALTTDKCLACHGGSDATQPGNALNVHGSSFTSLLSSNVAGETVANQEESVCFACHDGAPAKTDIETISSLTFAHDTAATSGLHASSGEGVSTGWNPPWSRHVECGDCHRPHEAAPVAGELMAGTVASYSTGTPDILEDNTKSWTENALSGYTVKMVSGISAGEESVIYRNTATTLSVKFSSALTNGDTYIILNTGRSDGNSATAALNGAWGVSPTWPAQPTPPAWDDSAGAITSAELQAQYNTITIWGRTENVTLEGEICIKCHSAYAYDATPPNTPSGNPTSSGTLWSNSPGTAVAQGDPANEFNPNNLAYHPVFAAGKNQPIVSSDVATSTYNPNWPMFKTANPDTLEITDTIATLTGTTLPVTVVPGWSVYIGSDTPAQGITGWYEIESIISDTMFTIDRSASVPPTQDWAMTAGLGNNFVPPWGPWSTMRCTDCHGSDSTTDPLGPHGSATKYMLRQAVSKTFLFYNGTTVETVTTTPTDSDNMCVNCHRRDVYGDFDYLTPPQTLYSRQPHPPIEFGWANTKPKWGMICMNCHGGARMGGIHGQNLGYGGGSAGASYSGRNLLGGAWLFSVTRSSTSSAGKCWTKGLADPVNNISHVHSGLNFDGANGGYATYDY